MLYTIYRGISPVEERKWTDHCQGATSNYSTHLDLGFLNNWGDIMERIYGEGFSYQSI